MHVDGKNGHNYTPTYKENHTIQNIIINAKNSVYVVLINTVGIVVWLLNEYDDDDDAMQLLCQNRKKHAQNIGQDRGSGKMQVGFVRLLYEGASGACSPTQS